MNEADIKAMSAELVSLREQVRMQACQIEHLTTALEHTETLLEAADAECKELRVALAVSRLSDESRSNVIQLIQEAA